MPIPRLLVPRPTTALGLRWPVPGLGAAAAGLLVPGVALADCPTPYTVDSLLADLMAVEGALRTGDDPTVTRSASALESGLPCLDVPLPRAISGRAYRAVGAGLLVGGQQDRGQGWLETAADLEPSFDFGIEDLPDPHPVRAAWMAAKTSSNPEESPLGGAWASGTGYVDGRKLEAPAARDGRPHLVQLQGDLGVQGWVVTGAEFPPAAVVGGAAAVADAGGKEKPAKEPKAPKEPKAKPEPSSPTVADAPTPKPPKPAKARPAPAPAPVGTVMTGVRNRPPEKTPLMLGGALITLGGGGVLYYMAAQNVQDFNDEPFDSAAVQSSWKNARLFTIASLSVAAVGAGTFTWGVILDGGGTPLPAVHLQF